MALPLTVFTRSLRTTNPGKCSLIFWSSVLIGYNPQKSKSLVKDRRIKYLSDLYSL